MWDTISDEIYDKSFEQNKTKCVFLQFIYPSKNIVKNDNEKNTKIEKPNILATKIRKYLEYYGGQ